MVFFVIDLSTRRVDIAGMAGALLAGRLIRSLLFEVSHWDPLTLVGVVSLLGAAGWLASYIPARRTANVDPMLTMKVD